MSVEEDETKARHAIEKAAADELLASHPLTMAQIEHHKTSASPWLIIHGKVYDCTQWQLSHPAGPAVILKAAGGDCTADFDRIHSRNAKTMVAKMCLGSVFPPTASGGSHLTVGAAAPRAPVGQINVHDENPIVVSSVDALTANTKRIVFAFEDKNYVLPLVCGGHVSVTVPGTEVVYRSYTPAIVEPGCFAIVVKKYPGGKGSGYLHDVKPGDKVVMRGPIESAFKYDRVLKGHIKRATLVAAGTGMAPIVSIARDCLTQGVGIILVAVFQTKEDILLGDIVESLQKKFGKSMLSVTYNLTREPATEPQVDPATGTRIFRGKLTRDQLLEMGMERDISALEEAVVCGTVAFNKSLFNILFSFGWAQRQITLLE